jgi:hypothetical protein
MATLTTGNPHRTEVNKPWPHHVGSQRRVRKLFFRVQVRIAVKMYVRIVARFNAVKEVTTYRHIIKIEHLTTYNIIALSA